MTPDGCLLVEATRELGNSGTLRRLNHPLPGGAHKRTFVWKEPGVGFFSFFCLSGLVLRTRGCMLSLSLS